MTGYEAIIGLEVHVQLATRSKMFCGCRSAASSRTSAPEGCVSLDAAPNTRTCPVCSGMPGALPVVNQKAVEYAIMAGLALNCQVAQLTRWDRKNYHYPDLPKGYQISQYDLPLCYHGWLTVEASGRQKRIRIRRAHLEEDTGKSYHRGDHSLIDLNRSGVPLLEIVTEPDICSAEEAYVYLTKLRTILRYLGVSTAEMEKGAMRCEPNVSIRPDGATELGTRTEIKNLNSLRAVRAAIAYEVKRQTAVIESGGQVQCVTMGWDEQRNATAVQRTKEEAQDYRYFPEPDLPPLLVSRDWVEEIRGRLPELPDAKRDRFITRYRLSAYDARVLVAEMTVADYFEAAVCGYSGEPKTISNWVSGELFRLMKENGVPMDAVQVSPTELAEVATLVDQGTINNSTAKDVLGEMFSHGGSAAEIVRLRGLSQISDQGALRSAVAQVLAENPEQVRQYMVGKETIIQWLMGQVMRATRGTANPQVVIDVLKEQLGSIE